MRFLNKDIIRNLSVMLFVVMIFSFPQISLATYTNTTTSSRINQKNKLTIVVKDAKSGAVVFRKQGAYFYALAKNKKIMNKSQIVPGEFIVKYKNPKNILGSQVPSSVKTIVCKFAAKVKELNHKLGLTLVQVPKDKNYFQTFHELRNNPNVEYVEPNYIVRAQFIPNDPYYGFQWGPQMIDAQSAWDKMDPAKRSAVTIAILDTGINSNQVDLQASLVPGFDFADDKHTTTDTLGHGTHVAGIAAGLANNGIGIVGVASGCKIMPIKVLDDEGSGSDANIVEGIKYATDHGAGVINMSLGGPGSSDAIQDAINYAISRGVNVVVAAGNENGEIDTPGNCLGVITVGAIERNQKRASYSNFGPKLDVVAPGTDILSTYIGETGPSGYTYFSGTSMATPFVSGVVALVKAVNPKLSPSMVTDIIHQSATDLGDPGFDDYFGYGLVNANKAVILALKQARTS